MPGPSGRFVEGTEISELSLGKDMGTPVDRGRGSGLLMS